MELRNHKKLYSFQDESTTEQSDLPLYKMDVLDRRTRVVSCLRK